MLCYSSCFAQKIYRLATVLGLLCAMLTAQHAVASAILPEEEFSDPALEAQAREIFQQLRCTTCQNQSLDMSNARIAQQMRAVIRQQLLEGHSEEDIRKYMRDRYGRYVFLSPPLSSGTILLWVMPALMFIGGFVLFALWRRRPSASQAPGPQDPPDMP